MIPLAFFAALCMLCVMFLVSGCLLFTITRRSLPAVSSLYLSTSLFLSVCSPSFSLALGRTLHETTARISGEALPLEADLPISRKPQFAEPGWPHQGEAAALRAQTQNPARRVNAIPASRHQGGRGDATCTRLLPAAKVGMRVIGWGKGSAGAYHTLNSLDTC